MRIARRPLLGLGAASLGAALLTGCKSLEQRLTRTPLADDALAPRTGPVAPAVRVLNRVAFGPRPGDVARVQKMGIAAYVEEQLHPEPPKSGLARLRQFGKSDDSAAAHWRVRRLGDTLNADASLLFDQDDKRIVAALRQATVLRAVYSDHQLYERMVAFWTDHFNIYAFKAQGPQYKVVDDRDTIRRHALGRFRDLLGASARSAAMLGYLDNQVNKKGVPNENYARELMELHTLGVDGGYTQKDVHEVARCLTGWTVERHWRRGRFLFDPTLHDDGEKRVLDVTIPAGGGVKDGDRVLDVLAAHPATARHIARKLCLHFLGDAPQPWVERLARVYRETRGDIKAMLRPLLTAPDLWEARPILKRPFDYAVSALRALNADTDGGENVLRHLEAMGQPSFGWPTPDGYPEAARNWTGTLIPRWNFALTLTANKIEDTTLDWSGLKNAGKKTGLSAHDALLEIVFGIPAGATALAPLRGFQTRHPDAAEYAAVLLMSPAFQWR